MINTKTEFGQYCLRKLGSPVINIEIDEQQIDDRIDEACQVSSERHFDATEEQWVHYQVTQDDIDNGYITVPSDILSVVSVTPANTMAGFSSGGMFSYQYQIMAYELSPWQPFDSIDYYIKMLSVEEIRQMVNVNSRFRWSRHESKVTIYKGLCAGENLLLRVYRILDPDAVWNDRWLKQYATALLKQQWGNNVGKFAEVTLLGGVTINGERLLAESTQELERLEEQLQNDLSEPTGFIFG